MIAISFIEIENNGKKSNHKYYNNDNSTRLVIIIPGGGNSCDRPILHFLRKYFLDNNCDILSVSYTNLFERKDSFDEKLNKMVSGVYEAIKQIELDKKFEDVIIVSRSIGNVVSSELKIRYSVNVIKNVYISPTSPALKYLDDYPGFIVSSSKDEYLKPEEIVELSKLGDDKILIFDDAGHNLETTNIGNTVAFCQKAVMRIVEFIEN